MCPNSWSVYFYHLVTIEAEVAKRKAKLWTGLVTWTYHPVDREKLVASLQSSMSVSDAGWDDSRDIYWGILLLPAHYVEPQTFFRFGKLHNTRMRVSLTCCKSCHSRLRMNTVTSFKQCISFHLLDSTRNVECTSGAKQKTNGLKIKMLESGIPSLWRWPGLPDCCWCPPFHKHVHKPEETLPYLQVVKIKSLNKTLFSKTHYSNTRRKRELTASHSHVFFKGDKRVSLLWRRCRIHSVRPSAGPAASGEALPPSSGAYPAVQQHG